MYQNKPDWLRIKFESGKNKSEVEEILKTLSLHTVCEQASCPNMMECFSRRTATFMILGKTCTRNCTFCGVEKGFPTETDKYEPANVAQAVLELKLKYVVVTSVTRDDLVDGGAGQFAETIRKIKEYNGEIAVEVLIPDFNGDYDALSKVVKAKPEVISHNIETVPILYPAVRPMAIYRRSLDLLQNIKNMDEDIISKSGIMLGLGEKETEVIATLKDLRAVNCEILTLGQYLSPSKNHHAVVEYIHPDVFENYKKLGLEMGFRFVASGPLVRSSYHADNILGTMLK